MGDKQPNITAFTSGMRGNEKPPAPSKKVAPPKGDPSGDSSTVLKTGDKTTKQNKANAVTNKLKDMSQTKNSMEKNAMATAPNGGTVHNAAQLVSEDDNHFTFKVPKKLFNNKAKPNIKNKPDRT